MQRYAAAILDRDGDDVVVWIEFYWADNPDHAIEQALDAHPGARIVTAPVPTDAPPA